MEKVLTNIEKRLDEAANKWAHSYERDSGQNTIKRAVVTYKAGHCDGVQSVIEEMERMATTFLNSEDTSAWPIGKNWALRAKQLREKFAPILERGRDAGTQN